MLKCLLLLIILVILVILYSRNIAAAKTAVNYYKLIASFINLYFNYILKA